MSLSAAGIMSGTTSVTGTFSFTAAVSDETNTSATASLDLIVAAQSATPGYTRWCAPTSFWNTPISSSASIDPNSAAMVSTAISAYGSNAVLDNGNDWGLSYVYAAASSKVYTAACTEYCNSSTTVFPIPAGALPNTGSDGHLAVINGVNEMDMWQASYNAGTDAWKAARLRRRPSMAGEPTAREANCVSARMRRDSLCWAVRSCQKKSRREQSSTPWR